MYYMIVIDILYLTLELQYTLFNFCFCCHCFGDKLAVLRGYSGIIPGDALGTIWDSWDRTLLAKCKANTFLIVLLLQLTAFSI